MAIYQTPGVYVEEISTLPPSVAQVATAVPAFIGYTEKGGPSVARIDTLLEYESIFGKAKPRDFKATIDAQGAAKIAFSDPNEKDFLMYYGLNLYFRNGGGSCYIISVGNYDSPSNKAKDAFKAGLDLLEMEDEPTLIVLLDAVNLERAVYYDLCDQALAQCKKLGDRFLILDIPVADTDKPADVIKLFRNQNLDNLMYGAAYYPYLQTLLNYSYDEKTLAIKNGAAATKVDNWKKQFGGNKGIGVTYTGSAKTPAVTISVDNDRTAVDFTVDEGKGTLTIKILSTSTGKNIAEAWTTWLSDTKNKTGGFDISQIDDGSGAISATASTPLEAQSTAAATVTLASIKTTQTELYNQIKALMNSQRITLPPSPAVAGVYARVDRERGVWKAPANVSLSAVIGPVSKITQDGQALLNIDPDAGKSINAIRDFTGKGTLIWGARTLAGNDNEWRYISVRRLFIMIEESARKATAFAVFEPNDATTWLKVKAMLESYLYGLWEQGALAGPKPESAYFVNVGLGKTMTAQDILEGRMIVEIGIAAVRPAEFIILRFSHKMQEA